MDALADGNSAAGGNGVMGRGASFNNPVSDGSSPSAFTSNDFEGQGIRAAQGSWQPATHFSFMGDQGDARSLLPTSFTGPDGYGNSQFENSVVGSSTWDNKLSYLSAASTGIAAGHSGHRQANFSNSLAIPGLEQMPKGLLHANPGPGHCTKAGFDYTQSALEHVQFGQEHMDGAVSSAKMTMLPQPWALPSGSSPVDLSRDGLPAQFMSFTSPHCLPSLPSDPEFAERAAKFSAFGMGFSESPLGEDGFKNRKKLNFMKPLRQRAAPSSPSGFNSYKGSKSLLENMRSNAREAGSAVPMEESCKAVENQSSILPTADMGGERNEHGQRQICASVNESDESMEHEVSSGCDPAPMQVLSESKGRKRKAGSQKLKLGGGLSKNPKDMDPDDGRPKSLGAIENTFDKSIKPPEQSNSGNSEESTPKSAAKEASKPPDPPKHDFIHVRARRGQATDSHSLAERVRREKISERMKFLQDLVPGCNKVTGKAVMLDEIINYVQSLQRQVEFLSMKLAAVNPRVEFSKDNLFARERPAQPRVAATASAFEIQNPNLLPPLHPHQQLHAQMQSLDQCPPLEVPVIGSDSQFRRTTSTPQVMEAYGDSASQQAAQRWDDELQSVVQMSLAQRQAALDLQGLMFQGPMKVEH